MTFKLYPCRRYHAHLAQLRAEQEAAGDTEEHLLTRDHTFCVFARNIDPVAANVPDVDDEFWDCPCSQARAARPPEQHRKMLWKTATADPSQLLRVRALVELADLPLRNKGGH